MASDFVFLWILCACMRVCVYVYAFLMLFLCLFFLFCFCFFPIFSLLFCFIKRERTCGVGWVRGCEGMRENGKQNILYKKILDKNIVKKDSVIFKGLATESLTMLQL